MSLAVTCLWIAFLWLVIYAVKYSRRRPKLLLPSSHARRRTTEVTVKHLNIRLKTQAFNAFHDKLSARLSSNDYRILRQILLRLYDLGSFIGIIGMLVGFCLLFFTVASSSSELLRTGRGGSTSTLMKRALHHGDITLPTAPPSNAPRINPIIPGLTVPLSHLPLILVALTISQVVHEAGHAITAALHHVPMLSCGLAVTFLLPSAFVSLPAARMEKLPPRVRLQIVSSGCFHNFVFLCLLLSAALSKASFSPIWALFQDTSVLGKIVIGVDYDSPLATHLPVGTLITNIDDFSMAATSLDDPWDYYLLSPFSGSLQGWCASESILNKASAPSCAGIGPYSCFVSKADEAEQYELDPVDIFTGNLARCNSSTECASSSSCVVPRRDQQLVRIPVLKNYGSTSREDTVVWKGPKEEIWEQVQVGTLRARFPFVSYKLPKLASAFFEYMKIANLSLYLVNMLPIAALDGHQSLAALLQLFYGRVSEGVESIDLEALNNSARVSREGNVQRACGMFLSALALFLIALCGLLGIINWAKK
ncbi:hypothetical protein EV363DRAFT_423617 [Boletus edulis]|nr:hypothetical protein EV363DRAFT_423617 [Boletus edulis]